MPKRELIINGFPLANDAVGIGAYGLRVARGLLQRRAELRVVPVIAAPAWLAARLDFGGDLRALASPRPGHPLLDQAVWSARLGAHARARGALLFSPAPFWSPLAPSDSVVCHHDRIYHHFPRYLGRKFVRHVLAYRAEKFLRRCRVIVTESEHARNDIAKIPGVRAESISVIRAWLPQEFNPEHARRTAGGVRKKYGLPERFWLYVGGYDYRKNVEMMIAAYAQTAGKTDAPRLVLAGRMPPRNGPFCDVEGAVRRAGLRDDAVIRPGFIDHADMPGLFGAAELMIYPSRHEGFGLPPMEAMGCGCPAICGDNSSLPEVVSDADYRFRDDGQEGLAKLLSRAATGRLPLNPAFTRDDFDERKAMDAYVNLFNGIEEK